MYAGARNGGSSMPPLLVLLIGVCSCTMSVALFIAAGHLYGSRCGSIEGVAVLLSVFCGIVGVFLVGAGGGGAWGKYTCGVRGDQLGVDSKWTWATQCVVKQGNRWMDIDKYRFEIGD